MFFLILFNCRGFTKTFIYPSPIVLCLDPIVLEKISSKNRLVLTVCNDWKFLSLTFGFFHHNKRSASWKTERHLKNGVSKIIVNMIEHTNFQLYRAYSAGVIWKTRLLTTTICQHTISTFYTSVWIFKKMC